MESIAPTSNDAGISTVDDPPADDQTTRRREGSVRRIDLLEPPLTLDEWTFVAQQLGLTQRQKQIVGLILRARKDKEISRELAINEWTVRSHLTRIFARTQVTDRVELVILIFAMARQFAREQPV